MIYNLHQLTFLQSTKIFTPFRKKNNRNKNNKTFSIKMKEDVGTSKACKQGWEANIGTKIKQTTSI